MIAAAAASSFILRRRQSRSPTARRLSASRLVRRSSSRTIGSFVRARRAATNASTFAVCFDGDPSSRAGAPTTIVVRKWMDEGKLPNLQKLARQGTMRHLETTHSPESPTAWASFATGVNAGKHNIYDFLIRDTNTYLPDLGMVRHAPPRFLLNYIP